MYALPPAVLADIERRARQVSEVSLQARASAVSEHYRRRQNSSGVIRTEADAAAYAVMRMPGTYAACSHAIHQTRVWLPAFAPTSLWDVGCGPGAASLAALRQLPSIGHVRLTDRIVPFLALASHLTGMVMPADQIECERRDLADIASIQTIAQDKSSASSPAIENSEMACISYVLTELDDLVASRLVEHVWQRTTQTLVLVEPGTPAGFLTISSMRRRLIALGASIVAPCTHAEACPRELTAEGADPSWCRFVERLPRTSLHRRIKQGQHGYEDESFSYLVATRLPVQVSGARVIGAISSTKAELNAPLCLEGRELRLSVPTRDKEKMSRFRRLAWGDHVSNP